jgi:NAD(P)-dependent dehydrogenase (short-subunit alcohol dehydrogenase family)
MYFTISLDDNPTLGEIRMDQLSGKVAVITGAASGVGKAAAILFAQAGASVVLADLNTTGGEEVAHAASQWGSRCVFQRTNVSSENEIQALIDRALGEFGKLNITFNNAGVSGALGPVEGISVEDWDQSVSILLRGAFLGIKHSVAPMRRVGGGSIISTASIAGLGGVPGIHAYSAAKAGVINLTRSTAGQLGPDFIRVNAIAPGAISTPMVFGHTGEGKEGAEALLATLQPLPRAGQPEDIARAALYLASDASSFVTGHTLVVDGGARYGAFSAMPQPGQPEQPQRSFAGPSFEG